VRQEVLGANIYETNGRLERIIALPHAQRQGDVDNFNSYVPLGKPKKKKGAAHKKRRANRRRTISIRAPCFHVQRLLFARLFLCAALHEARRANRDRELLRMARELFRKRCALRKARE